MAPRTMMAIFERARIRHLGPMLMTGSSQKAIQDMTMTTEAGIADLESNPRPS